MFKKLVLVLTLFSASTAVCMDRPEKRQAIEATEPTGQQVTIQTGEGQEFTVNLELAKLSVTFGHLIEDVDIAAEVVPLPSVSGPIWSRIQELLPDVQNIIDQESEEGKEASRAKIMAKLTSLSGDDLIEFIKAANYLDIPDLLSLAIDVAKKMSLGQLKSIKLQSFFALEKNIRNPIIIAQMQRILGPINVVEFAELKVQASPFSVCVTPDGSKIVNASDAQAIHIWDLQSHKELAVLKSLKEPLTYLQAACVTPDGSKIVSASVGGTIRIWDIQSHNELPALEGNEGFITSICVTPDGSKIVSGLADGNISIWDLESHKQLAVLEGHEADVESVCVTPDGSKIVSGSADGTIRIWDINTLKPLAVLKGDTDDVYSVCVTPDGSKIVSGSDDGTIRIWDLESYKPLAVLEGHDGRVYSVFVTPDGSKIVSGFSDTTIRIWDINTLKELAVLKGHTDSVGSVCVTPDGSKIVSGSEDKTIRIWDITIFNRLRDMNVEEAKQIWQYLQGDHAQGWQGVWRIISPQSVPRVQTIVVPPAMPMPVLPPRGEAESETKRHKGGE